MGATRGRIWPREGVLALDYEKPIVQLTGENGNAFAILGKVSKALKRAGLHEEAKKYMEEATSGDYDHLLQTSMKYVDVR